MNPLVARRFLPLQLACGQPDGGRNARREDDASTSGLKSLWSRICGQASHLPAGGKVNVATPTKAGVIKSGWGDRISGMRDSGPSSSSPLRGERIEVSGRGVEFKTQA